MTMTTHSRKAWTDKGRHVTLLVSSCLRQRKDDQGGSPLQVVDPVSGALVDPQLRHAGPNRLDVTRIGADEMLDPGLNPRSGFQITETLKLSGEPLCLADFNHPPTVASKLWPRNAALLAPIKDDTSFER
jgi:hypothetical protein